MRLAAVVLGLALGEVRPADACSPPPSGLVARVVAPPDQATEVPRNARVVVEYYADGGGPGASAAVRPVLVNELGRIVPTTADVADSPLLRAIVLTPLEPLDPSTTYQIWDDARIPCTDECAGPLAPVAVFTTGSSIDTAPPSLGAVSIATECGETDDDTCEPPDIGPYTVHTLTIRGASDDHPAAWLRYLYTDLDSGRTYGPYSHVEVGHGPLRVYPLRIPTDRLAIRAVDLAGPSRKLRTWSRAPARSRSPTPAAPPPPRRCWPRSRCSRCGAAGAIPALCCARLAAVRHDPGGGLPLRVREGGAGEGEPAQERG